MCLRSFIQRRGFLWMACPTSTDVGQQITAAFITTLNEGMRRCSWARRCLLCTVNITSMDGDGNVLLQRSILSAKGSDVLLLKLRYLCEKLSLALGMRPPFGLHQLLQSLRGCARM